MTRSLLVEDILSNIEFELAQGTVTRGDLGSAVKAVVQFQNKARTEAFASMKLTDPRRAILSRQFQIVDMLLNILQQMALTMQALQLAVERIRPLPMRVAKEEANPKAGLIDQPGLSYLTDLDEVNLFLPSDEIEKAMQADAIRVEYQARPIRIPLLGRFLYKLRILYQRPAQFYTQLLSNQQAEVNRVMGDRILYLEKLLREQQYMISNLSSHHGPKIREGVKKGAKAKRHE